VVVETRYVFRVSFPSMCTETLHADSNSELRVFLGKLQVIQLADCPVLYSIKVLCHSHMTHSTSTAIGQRKLAYFLTLFYLSSNLMLSSIYRVSREEYKKLRESVPYVKIYRYNPKHLYSKLNGYGDNGQRKVWSTSGFHTLYLPADSISMPVLQCGIILHLTLSL
jgi:hypothetical protein